MAEYSNSVSLEGIVTEGLKYSHEFKNELYYRIEIETHKHSTKKAKTPVKIRALFKANQVEDMDIPAGSIVELNGTLITAKTGGYTDISILTKDFSVTYNPDKANSQDLYNEVSIRGKVTRMFTNSENYQGFVNFVVADDESDNKFSVRMIAWGKLAEYILKEVVVGDHVKIRGQLGNSTVKSKTDNNTMTISEVVINFFDKE